MDSSAELETSVTLRSLSCPNCAGPLAARDGDRLVGCVRCGGAFLLPKPAGFARRYIPARIEKLKAVGIAKSWLQESKETPPDMGARSVVISAHLLYLPLWEARALVVGWEFGKKYRARSIPVQEGDNEYLTLAVVEEGVQEGLFTERRLYQAATDLSLLGIGRPQISGREPTLPLLAGELGEDAAVLEANRDHELVLEEARRRFLLPPQGTAGSARLFLLRESVSLLYYPLWMLRYRYADRVYEITVDGRDGRVHSARAPADNRRRVGVLVASYTALALLLSVVVWVWSTWEQARDVALYVGLLLLALTSVVYWRFRLSREVEYHEPFSY